MPPDKDYRLSAGGEDDGDDDEGPWEVIRHRRTHTLYPPPHPAQVICAGSAGSRKSQLLNSRPRVFRGWRLAVTSTLIRISSSAICHKLKDNLRQSGPGWAVL